MTIKEFALAFDFCFVGRVEGRKCCGPPEVHHIARGAHKPHGEADVQAGWICACRWCHTQRLASMSVAKQLAIKALCDPEGYDRLLVNRMRHRADDAVTEREVMAEVATLFHNPARGW